MSEALDSQWHKLLAPLSVEVLQYFKSDLHHLQNEQELFLGGETVCPSFNYTHINHAELEIKKEGLLSLQETILRKETNEVVRDLYVVKIDEYVANIELLISSRDASATADNNAALERFKRANEFLYGTVDHDVFMYTLLQLKRKLLVVDEEVKLSSAKQFEELWALVKDIETTTFGYPFTIVNTLHKDTTVVRDITLIKSMFEEGLREYGLEDTWSVVVDTTGLQRTFSVISHKRLVTIPGQEFFEQAEERGYFYTVARIRGLIAHEIGTHAVRRQNGKNADLLLLWAGLDHYTRGEEGIATYRSQQENHSKRFSGFLSYLCIGLAYGFDSSGQKKNFTQMHELFTSYFMVIGNYDEVRAKNKAWNLCWRIFRGTTCTESGIVFLKDKLYREGNILIHGLLHAYPHAATDLQIGRFDPTNRSHVQALVALDILPKDPWEAIAKNFCA